ncbi:MAG: hypothetical protein LAN70_11135 [Acidobacteriia bacterium]|nr:hypothetical protein [Terriglobia bacterium]
MVAIIRMPKKPLWTDEVFSVVVVSDPSFRHMMQALAGAADGGLPLYYAAAHAWAAVFSASAISLRWFSAVSFFASVPCLWFALRRFYGTLASAFAMAFVICGSTVIANQVIEARFYGLMFLAFSVAVLLFAFSIRMPAPSWRMLAAIAAAHLCLAESHLFGVMYSAVILLAYFLSDVRRRNLRPQLYAAVVLSWLPLALWVGPVVRIIATGRPHGWMTKPQVSDLLGAYAFGLQLLPVLPYIIVLLAAVATWSVTQRIPRANPSEPRADILFLTAALALVPIGLTGISYWMVPLLQPRYVLPCAFALCVALAEVVTLAGLDEFPRAQTDRSWLAGVSTAVCIAVISGLLLGPVIMARASPRHLPAAIHAALPPSVPIVVEHPQEFMPLVEYERADRDRLRFLLDSDAAALPDTWIGSVVMDNLLRNWRSFGYWPDRILDYRSALCSWDSFVVFHDPGIRWFDFRIRDDPNFHARKIDNYDNDGPQGVQTGTVYLVRRLGTPSYCVHGQ